MAYKHKNILNLQGPVDTVKTALLTISDEKLGRGSMDFNQITPMPPWVYFGKKNDEIMLHYGKENCWQSWCEANWGVSGNAFGLDASMENYDGGDTIEFDTSSGDVRDLIRKLSMMFPSLTVDYLWASEDIGKDVGMVQFKDGEQLYEYIPSPISSAAYELGFDIFAASAADFGLRYDPDAGTYHYDGSIIGREEEHAETEK